MIEKKNKISIHQMQILMIFNILGSSLLTFPKLISKASNDSFVFSIALGLILTLFSTFLIISSLKQTDAKSFNDFFKSTFGLFLTKIILLIFIVKIVVSLSSIIIIFLKMTESILLPKTNVNIVIITFLLLSSYLCYKEQSVRAKTSQMIFYIFMIYIFLFILASMFNLKTENLPNMLHFRKDELFNGSLITLFSFSSIIYFFFDYFYVEKKDNILKSSLNVVLLTGLLFLFITIIAISTFTLRGITFIPYPTFDTMSRLAIANSFITRSEAIVFNFWIFVIFSFVTTGMFYGHLALSEVIGTKKINNKYYIFIFGIIIYIICSLNINEAYLKLTDIYISLFLMIILPIVIIFKNYFSNKKPIALVVLLLIPLFLTSCTDKVELEDRRFVYELLIDKQDNNFVMTYDYSEIGSTKNEVLSTLETKSPTLLGCINKAYMSNENKLDFKQIKTIIISEKLLKDEKMLVELFNLLSENNEVGNNTIIISYDGNKEDIIKNDLEKQLSVSYFLTNFIKNNKNSYNTSINFDIDSILLKIRNNRTVILPSIKKDKQFKLDGGVMFTDFKYEGNVSDDIVKGYSLLEENGSETPISFKYNNSETFAKVLNSSSKVSFYEKDNKLYVEYKIKVLAKYLDPVYRNDLSTSKEKTISHVNTELLSLCENTFKFFIDNNVDSICLQEKLKQQDIKLYEKYKNDNATFLKNINPIFNISTKLDETF